jgi:fructosamine-3-kinase
VKSITTAPLLYDCPTIIVEFSFQDDKFIKPGKQVRLAEAATLDFIVRNTTITVPRVVDVVSIDGIVQIVQEFIDVPVLEVIQRRLPRSEAELHA